MQKTPFLFFILFGIVLSSCGTAKKTTATNTSATGTKDFSKISVSEIITANSQQQTNATWLSGNAGLDYKGSPMSVSASATIVWRRDSLIVMTIKKLGFNIAKAKITRDSVFIINQIQGSRISEPLSYIETKFGIPANFDVVQKILFGEPVFLTDKKNLTSKYDSNTQTLIVSGSDEKRTATYTFDTNFRLKNMTMEEPASARSINIVNDNLDTLGKTKFAYLRTININSPQTGKAVIVIDVDNQSIEIDVPKTIKF